MLLQIPVEGGHKGGTIKLNHHGNLKSFSTQDAGSKGRLSLVAFHNTCQQELEPITSGAMALLVVRLVWTNAPIDTLFHPVDIPAFIESFADVNKCLDLLRWNPQDDEDSEDSDDSSYNGCGSECMSDCPCYRSNDDDPYHWNHEDEKGFFFFLKNKYDLTKLKWSSLTGDDSHLALLFRCCPSVEVHLTVVEQTFGKESRCYWHGNDDGLLLTASNWIHPEIGPVHLSEMEGYPRGRLIHKKLKLYEKPKDRQPDREVEDPDSGNSISSTYLTPALCVWPKTESVGMYGFDSLLDCMESTRRQLKSMADWKASASC